jgi:lipoprotein-releasing system ATP-binding protein
VKTGSLFEDASKNSRSISPRSLVITSHPFALELRDVSHGAWLRGLSVGFAAEMLHVVRGDAESEAAALLRVAGLLDRPEHGEVVVRGQATSALDDAALAELRSRACGYVFAAPFLLAEFSTIENVAMPLFKIAQVGPEEARARTVAALEFVGLGEMIEAPASALPPADQRRVALARSLVHEPAAILIEQLDAPIEALPAEDFSALVRRACRRYCVAAIATVSSAFQPWEQDRVIDFADGAIRSDSEAVRRS